MSLPSWYVLVIVTALPCTSAVLLLLPIAYANMRSPELSGHSHVRYLYMAARRALQSERMVLGEGGEESTPISPSSPSPLTSPEEEERKGEADDDNDDDVMDLCSE